MSKGGITKTVAAALAALLAALPATNALAPGAIVDATCARHDQEVRLAPDEPQTYHLAGWLCASGPYDGQTVVLASPTGLSDHSYWDWPQDADTYSYVRHATAAGYAVFNYDRIGTGLSDRPPAAAVNVPTEAYVAHQLVQRLRAGEVDGIEYGKVVLLGNSVSTFISIVEAATYGDVDGLVNTGIFVGPKPGGLATLFAAFYPAQFDPKFADDDIPWGYATTQPGTRAAFFHLPAADPATVALDETLKDTATLGEATTFPTAWAMTRLVDVPVLSVMGDRDVLFCDPQCEPDGPEAMRERQLWGEAACLEIEIVEDAGHFLQLHPAAAATFDALMQDWLARRVGADAATAPSQPCLGGGNAQAR